MGDFDHGKKKSASLGDFRLRTPDRFSMIGAQGCGIKGFIPTSVIQGNLPLFMAGLSLGSPFRCITEAVVSHSPAGALWPCVFFICLGHQAQRGPEGAYRWHCGWTKSISHHLETVGSRCFRWHLPRVSVTPRKRAHLTPFFWAMTPFFKGHGESRYRGIILSGFVRCEMDSVHPR